MDLIITKIINNFQKHFHTVFGKNQVPKEKKRLSVSKFRKAEWLVHSGSDSDGTNSVF